MTHGKIRHGHSAGTLSLSFVRRCSRDSTALKICEREIVSRKLTQLLTALPNLAIGDCVDDRTRASPPMPLCDAPLAGALQAQEE